MGSPQEAALRHRLSSIRAVIQSLEIDLTAASPLSKPDIELLIRFFKSAEQNAKYEIELHELTHGGIDAKAQACSHPERYIRAAPPPPLDLRNPAPPGPLPSREERIASKKAELESELRNAKTRSSNLKKTIDDWCSRAFPEWERITADTRTRWADGKPFAIEQFAALKVHYGKTSDSQASQCSENRQSNASVSMPEKVSERPFAWSEIHSLAKEKIKALDSTIREEIGKQTIPIPERGADRRQFFLLLEEKANLWANRARDLYDDCLKQIGRENSIAARSSVYQNALGFFLNDNLRYFLYLECGCIVQRFYTVRRPGQPRTYSTTDVPHDIAQILSQIIERVNTRIKEQFMSETESWLEKMQRILREIQPQLLIQQPATSAPFPIMPVSDRVAPPARKSGDIAEKKLSPEILPEAIPPLVDSHGKSDLGRQNALLTRVRSTSPEMAFNFADAACIFNVTTRTIRNWIDEGKLDKGAKRGYVTAGSIKRNLTSSQS